MRILIAEDDFASRKFMLKFLSKFGECDITVDGMEAVDAYLMALDADTPEDQRAKIIMTTALNEGANVNKAFDLGCVAYAGKPIDQVKFESVLRKLELID